MVAAWDIDQTEGADAAWQCCGSLCLYRPCLACVFANTDGSPNIQCMDTTVTIPVQLGPIRITSMALVSRTGNGRFWPIPNSPPAPRRPSLPQPGPTSSRLALTTKCQLISCQCQLTSSFCSQKCQPKCQLFRPKCQLSRAR